VKVLDLSCQHRHVFEGWFGSEVDFQQQLEQGLLTCPVCGDGHISKQLSAPRLNLLGTSPSGTVRAAHADGPRSMDQSGLDAVSGDAPAQSIPAGPLGELAQAAQWNAMVTAALRTMVSRAEDMGDNFASEARRMHRGESEAKAIRGRTTAPEARALREEGIEVLHLPNLDGPSGTLQ
jgi:hypothetical protein